MSSYGISVREILKRTVIVEAENLEEAIQKVEDAVKQEKIILSVDDYDDREIVPYEYWEDGEVPVGENIAPYLILGTKKKVRLNFKQLYENGNTDLTYGGKIIYEKYDNEDFYDVLQEKSPHVLLVDKEAVEVLLETPDFVAVRRFGANNTVWLTCEEFRMATQLNQDFKEVMIVSLPYEIHYYRDKVHFKTRQFCTLDDAKKESKFLKSMGYSHSLWHYSELLEQYR